MTTCMFNTPHAQCHPHQIRVAKIYLANLSQHPKNVQKNAVLELKEKEKVHYIKCHLIFFSELFKISTKSFVSKNHIQALLSRFDYN